MLCQLGAVAQLGERVVRNDEVVGSIPIGSTRFPQDDAIFALKELYWLCVTSIPNIVPKLFGLDTL